MAELFITTDDKRMPVIDMNLYDDVEEIVDTMRSKGASLDMKMTGAYNDTHAFKSDNIELYRFMYQVEGAQILNGWRGSEVFDRAVRKYGLEVVCGAVYVFGKRYTEVCI